MTCEVREATSASFSEVVSASIQSKSRVLVVQVVLNTMLQKIVRPTFLNRERWHETCKQASKQASKQAIISW